MIYNILSFVLGSLLLIGSPLNHAHSSFAPKISTQDTYVEVDTTDEAANKERDVLQPRQFPNEDQVRSEYIVTYISSSTCVVAQMDRHDTIRAFIDQKRLEAEEQNRLFIVRGVSLDWDVEEGFSYLQSIADFDEISVGLNWINREALRLIWGDNDTAIQPRIPVLVIQERDIVSDGPQGPLRLDREDIVEVYQGLDEIEAALDE
ncbi:hypothetical protein [Longimonas halophila]|nr:hypothetical protein [Longimonas halophila]